MPNKHVRAAAEGMPNITRRHAFMMAGAVAALVVAPKPAVAATESPVAALEAAFNAGWAALRALEPALTAAERLLIDLLGPRPVIGELTDEEVETLRSTSVRDVAKLPRSRAAIAHAEALEVYKKAEKAALRKSGYRKLDREYQRAMHQTADAADAVLHYSATTLDELAAKVRVHRVWVYEERHLEFIVTDIARMTGIGGAA